MNPKPVNDLDGNGNKEISDIFNRASAENGHFVLSPEDAARVRALAAQNENSEIDPLLGSNSSRDYNSMVSDEANNNICRDIARRECIAENVARDLLLKEIYYYPAIIELLGGQNMDNTLLYNNDADFEAYIKSIEEMSFFESTVERSTVVRTLAEVRKCKYQLKAINDLRLQDNQNRNVMKVNVVIDSGIGCDTEEFEKNYEMYTNCLTTALEKLDANIKRFNESDVLESSKYVNEEMVKTLTKRLDSLNPDEPNYNFLKAEMETVLTAYKNITDLEPIQQLFENYLKSNITNMRYSLKYAENSITSKTMPMAMLELAKRFSNEFVCNVFSQLCLIFGTSDIEKVYMILSFLEKMVNSSKRYNSIYAKLMAINLSDIFTGSFDLGTDEYLLNIRKVFDDKLDNVITKNNLKIKNGKLLKDRYFIYKTAVVHGIGIEDNSSKEPEQL